MNEKIFNRIFLRYNKRLIPCIHYTRRHIHRASIPPAVSNISSKRQVFPHRGAKDPIALQRLLKKPTKLQESLLTAIKDRDTRAVYKAYMDLKESNQLHLLPKTIHSMALQSFQLKYLVAFQPHDVERYRVCIMNILEQMEKHYSTKPDVVDYNFVLEFYGRGKIWRNIHSIWKKIKNPDTYSYNCYMFAANQKKHYNWTLQLLQTMKNDQVEPDETTYNLLIEAHGGKGDVSAATKVFQQRFTQPTGTTSISSSVMQSTNNAEKPKKTSFIQSLFQPFHEEEPTFLPSKDTFIALIKAYGQNKKVEGLDYVYRRLLPLYNVEPDLKMYNALIEWYVHSDKVDTARAIIKEMEEVKGMKPDVRTFNYLFRYEAKKCNRPGIAEKLIQYMKDKYQLQPLPSMYKTLINNHNENRRLEESRRLLDDYISTMSFNRRYPEEHDSAMNETANDANVIPMKQT
ncbi:hypothetical protein BDF20DRAFT_811487 [Mycotypha africana]|uniref:uncharacterized protein n=1 Tax=Mycotypha africana TaxID=64632 RepID=UPI002301ECF7|nr:uncharacterized protein BDF20DRAFT_811487 [Mycotypha africana]KAI8990769.1 hypothetical protein BDF20DRAFT_811487 [Mycotypha africana]